MTASGLRAVFLTERPMLLRLVTARLASPADAEDVLQDMWLRLETLATGPVAKPAAYLYQMANNLASDRRRSALRRTVRDDAWQGLQTTPEELPDAEAVLIARDRLAQVEAALAALPEKARRAFRMFRFEGISQKAIATEMDTSLSSVEKWLQLAYRAIHDAGRDTVAGIGSPRRPQHERLNPDESRQPN